MKKGNFPACLKMVREQEGLTQVELAAKTGLHPSAISHFESGHRTPSLKNLVKLADALDVTTDCLLGRRDKKYGLCEEEDNGKF